MTEYMVTIWRTEDMVTIWRAARSVERRSVIWYRGPSRHASMTEALAWAQDWIAGVSDVCKVSIEVA